MREKRKENIKLWNPHTEGEIEVWRGNLEGP
jgi:hypothetical protein